MKKVLFMVFFWYIVSPLCTLCTANSNYRFTEGTIEDRLREGIEYARYRVDLCIRDFAALEIAEYLGEARERGVQVRVTMIEQAGNDGKGSLAGKLINKGIEIRKLKTQLCGRPVHDFVLLDDRVLVTGVYNWMAYRNRSICNDVVFYYDSESALNYKDTFWRLFTDAEVIPPASSINELIAVMNAPVTEVNASEKQTVQGNTQEKGQLATSESSVPFTEGIVKEYIDITFEEIEKQFGSESVLSRSEKKELWNSFKGKYVRWQGVVAYKGMGRVDWNRVGVNRRGGNSAEVEVLFDWRKFEAVMNIKVGSTITYTGKLVSRSGINAPYRLVDGDIE